MWKTVVSLWDIQLELFSFGISMYVTCSEQWEKDSTRQKDCVCESWGIWLYIIYLITKFFKVKIRKRNMYSTLSK